MDLNWTPEDAAFRSEVRALLAKPSAAQRRTGQAQQASGQARPPEWQAILHARGWLASHWPAEWGGPGWSVTQRAIFDTEAALAHAPRLVPFGINMLGPVLIKYDSEAQKAHWLPRIVDGSDWWCQGYSEPGAGSDRACLKCTAGSA